MPNIPKLKKKIHSFLTKEDGKISKENLIKAGVILSAIALSSVKGVSAGHQNTLDLAYNDSDGKITGKHVNHSSHGSHGSHTSGCSNISW